MSAQCQRNINERIEQHFPLFQLENRRQDRLEHSGHAKRSKHFGF